MSKLEKEEREIIERLVSAFERIAEAYEVQVISQTKMVEQTLAIMRSATNIDPT